MREMKESGIEWIGEIPANWNITKIKYLTRCYDGKRKPIDSSKRQDGIYPYWGAGSITDYIDDYIFDEELILLGEDGAPFFDDYRPVSFLVNERIWVNNHIHVLKSKENVDSSFLVHFLNSVNYRKYINGSILNKLTQSNMNNIEVCLPSFSLQQIIANFLDEKCSEIDSLTSDIQKQIETLQEYKKSVITEAVTKGLDPNVEMKDSGVEWISEIPKQWKISKIKYLFNSGKGLSITKENLIDEGLPVISYGQIHSKINNGVKINKQLLRFVSYDYQKANYNCQVKKYDFVFADTSEDYEGCGNCVYKRDDNILYAGYHTIILHSKIKRDNRYLAYLFLSDLWRKQIREVVYGVKVLSITQKILINASIFLPSESEQKQIADYLDVKCSEIDSLIEEKQKQLENLEQYKKSLIYEYVTGKKEVLE